MICGIVIGFVLSVISLRYGFYRGYVAGIDHAKECVEEHIDNYLKNQK